MFGKFALKFLSLAFIIRRCTVLGHGPAARVLFEFQNKTWVENIAVRATGDLLVTLIDHPELHLIDPFDASYSIKLATFPDVLGVLGIAEFHPDQFAVVAGNWSDVTFATTEHSYSIWEVDLRPFIAEGPRVIHPPVVKKITDIPEAYFLNGLTVLNEKEKTVLVSDSGLGVVWLVDLDTGRYHIALDDPTMKHPANGTTAASTLGINGIHIRADYVYYTNSGQELFVKLRIHPNGTQAGAAQILVANYFGDDFAFDHIGNAYVTEDPGNALYKVTPSGEVSVVLGGANESLIEGDTAAQFGRTPIDRDVLYITTNGGLVNPVDGPATGGKVIAFNTKYE